MKILHLTLFRKWFDLITKGEKKFEYRAKKEFWRKRLEGREYDEVHFRNGYARNAAFMRVQFLGLESQIFEGQDCYAIKLGKILELRNYEDRSGTSEQTEILDGLGKASESGETINEGAGAALESTLRR